MQTTHVVVTPSSATSPRWGQADNTQGKYDLISQAENHRAYFGATLNFAASDKHNIIQWPTSYGDPTNDVRSAISLWTGKTTIAKMGNFALH